MPHTFNGFIVFPQEADNDSGQTALVGEISPLSRTFSKEIGIFSTSDMLNDAANLTRDDLYALGFSTTNTVTGNHENTPEAVWKHILAAAGWAKDIWEGGQIHDDTGFNTYFENGGNGYVANNTVSGISIDETLYEYPASSGNNMPGWIEWTLTTVSPNDEHIIKIWLVDEAFQIEYPNFEIDVISPLVNGDIDQLNNVNNTIVQQLLDAVTPKSVVDAIDVLRDSHSPTYIRTRDVPWHNPDPGNSAIKDTVWTLLIYGPQGSLPENMDAAIVDYLDQGHVVTTMPDWEVIFPSIFINNEFIITPIWNKIAIPEAGSANGIYSPLLNPSTVMAMLEEALVPHVDVNDVNDNTVTMTSMWRSLAIAITGRSGNVGGDVISARFGDMAALPTTNNLDFNRMAADTQEFIGLMHQLLIHAEALTPTSQIPAGFNRTVRNGKLFITAELDGMAYTVLSKYSFMQLTPGVIINL